MKREIEFWSVENTGWSGGISWFKNELRYESAEEATEVATKQREEFKQGTTLWRVVHNRIVWDNNQKTTTETYTDLK